MKNTSKMDHGSLTELIFARRVKAGDNVKVSATKFGLTFNGKVAAAAVAA